MKLYKKYITITLYNREIKFINQKYLKQGDNIGQDFFSHNVLLNVETKNLSPILSP